MKKLQRLVRANAVVFLIAGCFASVHVVEAANLVHLRSGSSLVCDHQKILDGQVRLYLTPSDDSYLDVPVADILSQETAHIEPANMSIDVRQTPPGSRTASVELASTDLAALLQQAGAKHHLDPDLLASVVHAESSGHARVVSRVGAKGLMQLMPGTAADLGVQDSFAPEQNVAGGTTYLDALLMYYHENLALALAAYNAGPAAVDRYHGIPPYLETRRYVERVIHDYNRRKLQEAQREHKHVSHEAAMASIVTRP